MRKVIFTESQLRGILGEEFMSYLNTAGDNGIPGNSYGVEVAPGEKDDEGNFSNPEITDKIADELASTYPIWGRGIVNRRIDTMPIAESNQELDRMGKSYNVGPKMQQMAQNIVRNNPNDEIMGSIAKGEPMTFKDLQMRLKRIRDMRTQDPERYRNINGGKWESAFQSMINTAQRSSLNSKKAKMNAGQSNAFQKAGYTKESGNGKAHTPKPAQGAITKTSNPFQS